MHGLLTKQPLNREYKSQTIEVLEHMNRHEKQELIKNLTGARIRTLLSKTQYRQFYEDIICGYFEFLKPHVDDNLKQWSWHLFKRHLNHLHQPETPKEYRPLKNPIRGNYSLQDIITCTTRKQFFELVDLVMKDYLDILPPYVPFRKAKDEYYEFLGTNIDNPDQLEEIDPNTWKDPITTHTK